MKIGFIGAGNMGLAMMQGAMNIFGKDTVMYTDASEERLKYVESIIGIPYEKNNNDCIQKSDFIILAVKPQYFTEVLKDIVHTEGHATKILISIAPGITIDLIKTQVGAQSRVVRAMPNTPAMVMSGMSAVCFSNDAYTEEEKAFVMRFFNSFGETVTLTEKQLDIAVPVSGSSPAYVYMFIEAMADAAVLFGLPRPIAYKMAAQSVLGSARMVLETGEHPGVLKDAVCSPGGTTIEAVRSLEQTGFRSSVIEAMSACYEKTLSFGK